MGQQRIFLKFQVRIERFFQRKNPTFRKIPLKYEYNSRDFWSISCASGHMLAREAGFHSEAPCIQTPGKNSTIGFEPYQMQL